MSLPDIHTTTITLKRSLFTTKIFTIPYLKKHHWIFATELIVLTLIGSSVAFGAQAGANKLIAKPEVLTAYPSLESTTAEVTAAVNLSFSSPVDTASIQAEISPEVEGEWVFSETTVGSLLPTELSFEPESTLEPDSTYEVKVKNIRSVIAFSKPYDYSFSFKTKTLPKIKQNQPKPVLGPKDNFIIELDSANDLLAEFDFKIVPEVEFTKTLSLDKKQYLLKPTSALAQGSNYQVTAVKYPSRYNLKTNKLTSKGQAVNEATLNFTTMSSPKIVSVSSTGETASRGPITVVFDKDMDKDSVAQGFGVSPNTQNSLSWVNAKTLVITPTNTLPYNTTYKLIFAPNTHATDGTYFEKEVSHSFTTIGNVKVLQFSPGNGSVGVSVSSKISVVFNQSVNMQSAQDHFVISPSISGSFSWNKNTMTFSPSSNFPYRKTYTVTITNGVKSLTALDSVTDFSTKFTTADLYETVRLNVPTYYQKYVLSCEFADMRMVLAYRGINKSEDQLIAETPFDKTPRSGGVWGDPDLGFVGEVDGTWFGTGYGAYHPVVSGVVGKYRPTTTHVGWNTNALAAQIKAGNPVLIWGCTSCIGPTYWNSPAGKKVRAYKHYHIYVVNGYKGNVNNPTHFILKDSRPGWGEITLTKAQFLQKWQAFNYTAVVVK